MEASIAYEEGGTRDAQPRKRKCQQTYRAVCGCTVHFIVLLLFSLLPTCSTSAEARGSDASPRAPVLSVTDLVDAISAGGGRSRTGLGDKLAAREGSVTPTASLLRGLADILKDAPRLHVAAQRRSVHPDDLIRLEVEDTGHAVTVTRAHMNRQRLHTAGWTQGPDAGHPSLRSPATYHRYDIVSPQDLLSTLNCTSQAQSRTLSNWKDQSFNVISHAIGGKDEVIAVVVADPDTYKKEQWVNDQDERQTGGISIDYSRVGFSIVRYDFSGSSSSPRWISGSGAIGYRDGNPWKHSGRATSGPHAVFSDRITSLAWYPSCSDADWTSNLCPPTVPGPARPNFHQPVGGAQWIYVADSGNCRVRLVDYRDGDVETRWGTDCLNETAKHDLSLYKDSNISARNVLGSDLSLAWVSWKFLLVLDSEAHRIRKFVTSQHQGLSPLAGGYNTTACNNDSHIDGDGLSATFCRPEAVTVSADGSRVVVSESLEHYGSGDAARRLRVLDLHYTYLEGGDVADVSCTVRTLRRMSMSLPGNSLLWSRLGGMVLSPDGRVLIGGSADPFMLNFKWNRNHYLTGGDSFVVALALETGQLRLLLDAGGRYLHDATVLSAVGLDSSSAAGDWYMPESSSVKLVMARHSPGVCLIAYRRSTRLFELCGDDLSCSRFPPPAVV